MKKLILITFLIPVLMFNPQGSIAQTTSVPDTALTFVLSNEAPGYLIDNLIAAGFGNSNLYEVLVMLKPASGGVISDEFLAALASCPAGSEIFSAALSPLSAFAGLNGPVCINTDGTISINPIFGKDFFEKEGYATYNDSESRVNLKLFTYAKNPEYYFDAGATGDGTTYQAFAIAWSLGSTFILSNESPGYLIDNLITNGYGNKNLFQVLQSMQPASGGVIPDDFISLLSACPPGSEIFTAKLSTFAGWNNPICVNSDGTLKIRSIFGRDYFGEEGYTTYPEGETELFTYATSPQYYIDAGASGSGTRYQAFAIAWSNSTDGIPDAATSPGAPYAYPNPFTHGFYVHNLLENARLEIFDIHGKLLYQTEPRTNRMVQPGQLPEGIYFLKLTNNQGARYQKIVKY
ncbi:MAG: T9SS type A sorting domain-containing protein [Bacteroidia bacterium]|nr:T9SS type A sorting domain-containing protein [Bacteroidia bacterium]